MASSGKKRERPSKVDEEILKSGDEEVDKEAKVAKKAKKAKKEKKEKKEKKDRKKEGSPDSSTAVGANNAEVHGEGSADAPEKPSVVQNSGAGKGDVKCDSAAASGAPAASAAALTEEPDSTTSTAAAVGKKKKNKKKKKRVGIPWRKIIVKTVEKATGKGVTRQQLKDDVLAVIRMPEGGSAAAVHGEEYDAQLAAMLRKPKLVVLDGNKIKLVRTLDPRALERIKAAAAEKASPAGPAGAAGAAGAIGAAGAAGEAGAQQRW